MRHRPHRLPCVSGLVGMALAGACCVANAAGRIHIQTPALFDPSADRAVLSADAEKRIGSSAQLRAK